MLLPADPNLEIYLEPELDTIYSNSNPIPYTVDYSGKGRTVTCASNQPIYSKPAVNGKAAIYWDGTMNPLANSAVFKVFCGFVVAKYNAVTFPTGANGYKGLLTDLNTLPVLAGNPGTSSFFDFVYTDRRYEFRSNDRIYSRTLATGILDAPAPMNVYKLMFFRFFVPQTFNGIQLGQDRATTTRKWSGTLALLALYSRNLYETDIRAYSKIIADNFALTLADVYPYQADNPTPQNSAQSVNFYDPPEGDRISEVLGSPKQLFDLKFGSRRQAEVDAMLAYHGAHYATAVPCIYRDYKFIPPRDVEGYINSDYSLDGAVNNFNYGFAFKEK